MLLPLPLLRPSLLLPPFLPHISPLSTGTVLSETFLLCFKHIQPLYGNVLTSPDSDTCFFPPVLPVEPFLRPLHLWADRGSCFPDLGGEKSCLQCGRTGFDPWVGKIHWRRKWQFTPVFLPGKSHGQRSLDGCSPWGHKESDTTEQLTLSFMALDIFNLFQFLMLFSSVSVFAKFFFLWDI